MAPHQRTTRGLVLGSVTPNTGTEGSEPPGSKAEGWDRTPSQEAAGETHLHPSELHAGHQPPKQPAPAFIWSFIRKWRELYKHLSEDILDVNRMTSILGLFICYSTHMLPLSPKVRTW